MPDVPIQHPACKRDVDVWLDRIATPMERERALTLLCTLRPGGAEQEEECEPQQQSVAEPVPSHPQGRERAASASGWTYTATRAALQRGTVNQLSLPFTGSLAVADSRPATVAAASTSQQPTPRGIQDPSPRAPPAGLIAAQAAAGSKRLAGAANGKKQAWAVNSSGTAAAGLASTASSSVGVNSCYVADVPADVTTYHMAFHLAQMYPELYAQALAATKAAPPPNYTLTSDWGDSLRQGEDGDWRARFLRSVYDATNAEVYPQAGPPVRVKGGTARSLAGPPQPGEAGFFRWLKRQQTYYRSLLEAGLLPAVDAQLSGSPGPQQREVLDTLRQVHAVARPELLISHSQAAHCPMRPAEDPELTALEREMTRVRTMGFPPPQVDGKYPTIACKMQQKQQAAQQRAAAAAQEPLHDFQPQPNKVEIVFGGSGAGPRPFTANAARKPSSSQASMPCRPASALGLHSGAGEWQRPSTANGAVGGGRKGAKPMKLEKETFKSKLPLQWAAAASLGAPSSTYTNAFGSLAAGAARRLGSAAGSKPVRYREVTAPIGAVNPVTAMVPARPAYPVPECFTLSKPFPQDNTDALLTTNRESFATRAPEDVIRTLKASAEATATARVRLNRSTLPLGPGALCMLPPAQWASEKQANYTPHMVDVAADYERAQTLKRLLGGPTAATGRLTAPHHHEPFPAPRAVVAA